MKPTTQDRAALISVMDAAGRADIESVLESMTVQDIAAAANAAIEFLEEADAGDYIKHGKNPARLLLIIDEMSAADPAAVVADPGKYGKAEDIKEAARIAATFLDTAEACGYVVSSRIKGLSAEAADIMQQILTAIKDIQRDRKRYAEIIDRELAKVERDVYDFIITDAHTTLPF